MSASNLEKHGAAPRSKTKERVSNSQKSKRLKDWKRTIGIFTDDDGMKQIFVEAMKIRERNRQQARRRLKNRRNVKS